LSTRFVGLDLAWSPRNGSGAVVFEADSRHATWAAHSDQLGDDESIVAFVREAAGSDATLVAVDAPLIVPNDEGSRPVDRLISRLFGRFGGGCYPAFRNRPGGCTRGERIVAALARDGFTQDPYIKTHADVRTIFEVYPHPAMVSLFHLEHTLSYKARPNRTWSMRQAELERLRALLLGLEQAEPSVSMPSAVANEDIPRLNGVAFKRHEDLLDAAMCAYIACYAWYWGTTGYRVYGNMTQGYILVPMTQWMKERLETFDQLG